MLQQDTFKCAHVQFLRQDCGIEIFVRLKVVEMPDQIGKGRRGTPVGRE